MFKKRRSCVKISIPGMDEDESIVSLCYAFILTVVKTKVNN